MRSSGTLGDATARCPSETLLQRPMVQCFTTFQIDQPGTHITKDVEKMPSATSGWPLDPICL